MLAPEYGAAEEKRKKEEEAEAFAAKMNSKYNNQEQMLLEIGMLCPFRMSIVLMIVFILCFILESFLLLVIILRIHSSGESLGFFFFSLFSSPYFRR